MKTIHYPNTLRSHLATIVPIAPFTPKLTSKLRSSSASIPELILRNPNNHYNHGFSTTCSDYNHYVYSDFFSVTAVAHIIRY